MAYAQVEAIFLWVPLVILYISFKLVRWTRILFPQRKTLSLIPGPRWAAWTRLWLVKILASGDSATKFVEVNKRYGKLARIGPNHLITSDPAVIRNILAARSKYSRGPWFDSLRIDPRTPNIVSERDMKQHSILRQKLATSYTPKSIRDMEPVIDEQILRWLRWVDKEWTSQSGNSKLFDMGRRIQYLTVDIITKVCLGEELGDVASDSDKFDFLSTVQTGNSVCQHMSVLLELNTLMYYFTKIPWIGQTIVAKPSDSFGVGKILGIVQRSLDSRIESGNTTQKDLLGSLLQKGVPHYQIDAEIVISLVAGSDTTSTSIQSTLLAIILNPRVYSNLKREIQQAITKGTVSHPVQDSEARELPYLQACVLEGLRKHPPLSQLRERVVPPEGDTIQGHHIPGGTYIGLNAWGTQLDEVYGDDPDMFRPERWLIEDEERLKAMHQAHELIFGYGSTKCLGASIAMMELNKMIFEIFRYFDVTIANPYKPWSSICYGIFFQKDFKVHLTRTDFLEDHHTAALGQN